MSGVGDRVPATFVSERERKRFEANIEAMAQRVNARRMCGDKRH